MTGMDKPPNHLFPTPPPDDVEHRPCRQMWGLLIQQQVESQDFQAPLIKEAVATIMASEACKSHPATCACKVPNNPWTYHDCVEELKPLGLKHNPGRLREVNVARDNMNIVSPPVSKLSVFDYKHHVDSCACGTCHKARCDSGTQGAYYKRVHEAAEATIARVTSKREDLCMRQDRVNHYAQKYCDQNPTSALTGILQAAMNADTAINKASAACDSSGPGDPEFAKALFAAMGTPHNFNCPCGSGLPSYACMPCSH